MYETRMKRLPASWKTCLSRLVSPHGYRDSTCERRGGPLISVGRARDRGCIGSPVNRPEDNGKANEAGYV